jgi:hypothetical protein
METKKMTRPAKKKSVSKLMVAMAVGMLLSLGQTSLLLADKYLPKYKAGQCLVSKSSPQAYVIEKVENGRYQGVHILLMFGLPLNMPVGQLQADGSLVEVNCQNGEPVK